MSGSQHLNEEALKELKDVMEDDFQLLIDTFIMDSDQRIESLDMALSNSDAELIRATAHSFKGSSSNICAPLLSDLCRELEACGREGDLAMAPALFADIKAEYDVVKQSLQAF